MFSLQVIITFVSGIKQLYTEPAHVALALATCHVITTFVLLNGSRTARASLTISRASLHPFFQLCIPHALGSIHATGVKAFMPSGAAFSADVFTAVTTDQ